MSFIFKNQIDALFESTQTESEEDQKKERAERKAGEKAAEEQEPAEPEPAELAEPEPDEIDVAGDAGKYDVPEEDIVSGDEPDMEELDDIEDTDEEVSDEDTDEEVSDEPEVSAEPKKKKYDLDKGDMEALDTDDDEDVPEDNSDLFDDEPETEPETEDIGDEELDEPKEPEELDETSDKPSLPRADKKVFFNIPIMEALAPHRMPPETVGDLMAILRYSNPTDKILIRSAVGKNAKTIIDVNRKIMVDGQNTTYIEIV